MEVSDSIHSRRVGMLESLMTDNAAISLRAESTRKGLCLGVLLMMTWRIDETGRCREDALGDSHVFHLLLILLFDVPNLLMQ